MSLIDDGITTKWRLGAWCPTTGYPRSVAFHEERLYFASTPTQPNTIWGSVAGDYTNHAPTDAQSRVLDDNALNYSLASGKLNEIRWLDSGPTLVIGTLGDEWQVRAASGINNPITPTDISVVRHTSFGSNRATSLRIGGSVIFLQRSGGKLRELYYDYDTDSLQSRDITIVSEHILRRGGGANRIRFQQEPNTIIWCVREDGILAGLTYFKEQDVYAWHTHKIGGTLNGSHAKVMSIAVVSSQEGEDVVYLAVKRTIGGQETIDIETFSIEYEPSSPTDKSNFHFVDAGIQYNGVLATAIGGLEHLNGETVDILADGISVGSQVVAAGQITLTTAAQKVSVGLRCRALIESLDYEGMNVQIRATIGKIRRIDTLALRVLDSMGFKAGPTEAKLREFSFRKSNDAMDAAAPLFSGDHPISFETGYSHSGSVVIAQDKPYPLNILAIVIDGESA